MTSKLILISTLVTLVCHYVNGRNTVSNQDLMETEKEERTFLIEIPLLGSLLMVTFKILGFIMNIIGPLFYIKMAAITLIANVASWLHQNYVLVLIGSAVILGFCVLTGTFTLEDEMDHRLIQAARQLETGALKYARMIN